MNIQDFITTETVVVRGRRNIEIARILTAMKALRLEVDHGLKMSRANVFQICKGVLDANEISYKNTKVDVLKKIEFLIKGDCSCKEIPTVVSCSDCDQI